MDEVTPPDVFPANLLCEDLKVSLNLLHVEEETVGVLVPLTTHHLQEQGWDQY